MINKYDFIQFIESLNFEDVKHFNIVVKRNNETITLNNYNEDFRRC